MLTRRHARYVTLGLIFVLAAQWLMTWHEPVIQHFLFSDKLNALLDLGISNPENTILATVLLASAGLLFVYGTLPIPASSASFPGYITSTFHRFPPWLRFTPLVMALPLVALIVQRATPNGYTPVLPWVWLIVLALLTLAAYLFDQHARVPLSPGLHIRDLTLMVTIVAFGLAVGTYELGGIPRSLWATNSLFGRQPKVLRAEQTGRLFLELVCIPIQS